MPRPSNHEEPELAEGEMPDYYHKMDRRLIILETRFDTILPTLATKSDLIELRAGLREELRPQFDELNSRINAMTKWIAALAIGMLIGFGGVVATLISK